LDDLLQSGYSIEILRQVEDMTDYDLFDILIEIAFGKLAKNKIQRVLDFQARERNWLYSLPQETKDVIIAIVNQFAVFGTDCMESKELLNVYDVVRAGGIKALNKKRQRENAGARNEVEVVCGMKSGTKMTEGSRNGQFIGFQHRGKRRLLKRLVRKKFMIEKSKWRRV
jgi:type I restriction enzyme R subunit